MRLSFWSRLLAASILALAGLSGGVVVEDLVGPAEDGFYGFAVLGYLAGLVEGGEPVEGYEGFLRVGRLVDLVEFLEGLPSGLHLGVSVEQAL